MVQVKPHPLRDILTLSIACEEFILIWSFILLLPADDWETEKGSMKRRH